MVLHRQVRSLIATVLKVKRSLRYQCQGLGTELLKRLLQVGRDEHLTLRR
ncbi:MAG: hypothetical protein ICV78_15485 [Tolypothrix sp. Co-bin9]|nr:hypothetical protein [Tolypothrix sp. Co-bin9]